VAVQFHLVVELEMTLLDSLLDPHPEDPAVVDGVRIPVMEATVMFLSYSIRPKHGMPLRQFDSAFLHQEFKQLINFSDIKVVCAFGLLDLALIHGQWLFAPPDHHRNPPSGRLFPGTDCRYRLYRATC
jgi:hypothetical protein